MAIALLIGLVRAAWFRVVPGAAPVEPGFAPPATRPAPGVLVVAATPTTPGARPSTAVPRGNPVPAPAPWRSGVAFVAVGAAVYTAVVAGLGAAGLTAAAATPVIGWLVRDVLIVGLAAAALLLAHGRMDGPVAYALAAAGGTFFVLGLLDMHLFGLFELSPLADAAFHGAGPLVAAAGLSLTLPRHSKELA